MTQPIDQVLNALAHPVRRKIVERLSRRPASVTELAADADMALPSFLEHLTLLEQSGLVRSRKEGRVRTCRLATRRLQVAETWLARQRSVWEQRLNQLDEYLLSMKEKDL
jgi:DNA-binding transcriptional ArsR family regulator